MSKLRPKIGVLALQGDFCLHQDKLSEAACSTELVKSPEDLQGICGLVFPGGESSAMLKLGTPALWNAIKARASEGLPILATCAGVILVAKVVSNPEQESLGLIDIDVSRNFYGRQVDSEIVPEVFLTDEGQTFLEASSLEGVFIRAPGITRFGKEVQVLATRDDKAVFVRQGSVFALTYHPELSSGPSIVHERFSEVCSDFQKNLK